jgi:short-subunit dehydrogenase
VARNKERLESLVLELGGQHSFIASDLSTPSGVKKIQEELSARHYSLLVNNAGFGLYGKFDKHDIDKSMAVLALNVDALVKLSHTFLESAEPGDALINVSSVLAFAPMPLNGIYSATKAFVTSFSESLWYEQKDRGVYVMNLCPGVTETEFHRRAGGTDKKRPPQALIESPEAVVDCAMKALGKRKSPTIISGHKNQILAQLMTSLPRKSVLGLMGSQMKNV